MHFDPQARHEQTGHGPAVVLSPAAYNDKTSLALCCPMTTQVKGCPFEVPIRGKRAGVVLADQVKSLDWCARNKGKVSVHELALVHAKACALIGTA